MKPAAARQLFWLLATCLSSCAVPEGPARFITHAERTAFDETGRYAEALALAQQLDAASPWARCLSFGTSGAGRELPLLVFSREGAFTPEAARRSARPLVLIQNAIHAGECEGKDACLMLAREILITRERADLLERVNLLIIPIFNVDGHERFGPFNRINQIGPREMGWRTTAVNLNLNRDYVKADSPEMQAWLRLWTAWQPDLLIDTHGTDGREDQYDVFYAATVDDVPPVLGAWVREAWLPPALARLEAAGIRTLPYGGLRDAADPSRGFEAIGPMSPRMSTGYAAACNRPAILVEAHARKPYGRRVHATFELLCGLLEAAGREGPTIRHLVRAVDAAAAASGGAEHDGRIPLSFRVTAIGRPLEFLGVAQITRDSLVTGRPVIEYGVEPVTITTELFERFEPAVSVAPPGAYLVPAEWTQVVERLERHGVRCFRLREPLHLNVECYHFTDVRFEPSPYEGRQIPHYQTHLIRSDRDFAAGTVVVPMDQPRAKLAAHLLEPDGPDALLRWGLLNSIFEQKEYAEDYVLEPLARQMLAERPDLAAEFAARLGADPAFAASAERRRDFIYRRSPYWDTRHNVYPIARLPRDGVAAVKRRRRARRVPAVPARTGAAASGATRPRLTCGRRAGIFRLSSVDRDRHRLVSTSPLGDQE